MNEHPTNIPETDPSCFWGFVQEQDPALSAYASRPDHTDAEKYAFLMGGAAGRLHAIYALAGYKLDGVTDDLEYALDMYLAVLKAMLRRRSPRDFTVALARQDRTRRDEQVGLWFEKRNPQDSFINAEPPIPTDADIERERAIDDNEGGHHNAADVPHDPDNMPGGEDDPDAA